MKYCGGAPAKKMPLQYATILFSRVSAYQILTMRLNLTVFTLVASLISVCCNPCDNLDCIVSNDTGQFRLVSADDTDLLFGQHKRYNKDSIRFYSLEANDTTFLPVQAIRFPNTGYDSILVVQFSNQPQTAYMQLSNGDIDTLQLTYKSYDTRCCGHITDIMNFRVNGKTDLPGGAGTLVILK